MTAWSLWNARNWFHFEQRQTHPTVILRGATSLLDEYQNAIVLTYQLYFTPFPSLVSLLALYLSVFPENLWFNDYICNSLHILIYFYRISVNIKKKIIEKKTQIRVKVYIFSKFCNYYGELTGVGVK